MGRPRTPDELVSAMLARRREAKRKRDLIEKYKNPVAVSLLRSSGDATRPPAEVLFDRDRRMSAPETLDMLINGTPRPGQSALDKMRGAAA